MNNLTEDSALTRLALLEQTTSNINETLKRFENKFDKLDTKIDSNFRWMLGIIIGLAAIMAHGFHWF